VAESAIAGRRCGELLDCPHSVESVEPIRMSYEPPRYALVRKSNANRIAAVVVGGLLVLCCGGIGLAALTDDTSTTTAPTAATGTAGQEPTGDAEAGREPEAAPADDAGSFNVPAGSRIVHRDGGGTVQAVMRSVRTHRKACNSIDVEPENGLFVVVDVIVSQTKGKGSVNPLDFTFVAEDGTSANALSAVFWGCDEPSLAAADLRAGQKRAGKIAFDASMRAGTLEWAPGGLGSDTAGSWVTK
jgi:hypothetical protein